MAAFGHLADSSAEAPPAKSSEKGYGDENDCLNTDNTSSTPQYFEEYFEEYFEVLAELQYMFSSAKTIKSYHANLRFVRREVSSKVSLKTA